MIPELRLDRENKVWRIWFCNYKRLEELRKEKGFSKINEALEWLLKEYYGR